jgi:small conductance mechanosensitive channel
LIHLDQHLRRENIMVDQYILPWAIDVALAIAIFFIGKILIKMILGLFRKILNRSNMDQMLVDFVLSITNAILFLVVIVAALDRLGVDTTSLIAIVGAAGLAIGLSLQDSLKNFAAGVMLLLFKPFKEGDFIEAAGVSGIVEKISIFNSMMRTVDNRSIIVPNGSIYGGVIINYSAKDTRRVDMVFGIGYEADLRKAKQLLADIIAEDDRILKDPETVIAVSELADSSVNFIVRPWVNSADYWVVLWDTTEKVKLRFDEAGISIPFPQMDVHLHKQD